MAGKIKDGTWSFLSAARIICRLYAKYGKRSRIFSVSPAFGAAVEALALACAALEALDDYPFEIDNTVDPNGTGEDDDIGGSAGGGV